MLCFNLMFQCIIFVAQVTTTVTMKHLESIHFPAVTICNQNRVHCKNAYKRIKFCKDDPESTCSEETKKNLCMLYNIGICYVSVAADEAFKYGEIISRDARDICIEHKEVPTDDDHIEEYFINYLVKLPDEDRFAIAHQPQDLIR